MQISLKWTLRGFDNYYISTEGWVIRKAYKTTHLHFKETRFICENSRSQFILYRNNEKEIWSKRQLRNILTLVQPAILMPRYSELKSNLPF